ncbi:MAG: DUF4157 domain-containing protein, partial [Azospirillaceae bacterium]
RREEAKRRERRRDQERGEAPTLPLAPPEAVAIPLPHRGRLEGRFGTGLGAVKAYTGPRVAEALEAMGADAATVDGAIYLPRADVPYKVVAHEVVHVVQAAAAPPAAGRAGPLSVLPPDHPAEKEAAQLEEEEDKEGGEGAKPAAAMPGNALALRRSGAGSPVSGPAPAPDRREPEAPERRESARSAAPASANENRPSRGAADAGQTAAGETEAEPNPTFTPPPMPDTALSPEQQAAREAEQQAAEEAIAAADSPGAVVDAYAEAPPSVKARRQGELGGKLQDTATADSQDFNAGLPDLHAEMGGEGEALPAVPPVETPDRAAAALEDDAPPDPETAIAPTPAPARFDGNDGVRRMVDGLLDRPGREPAPEDIEDGLDAVATEDPGIATSPGAAPGVPLEGATEPARQEEKQAEAAGKAGDARREAQQKVLDGPGPESVTLRSMDEAYPVEGTPAPEVAPVEASPEAARLEALALPDEVSATFDAQQKAPMEQSLAEARGQVHDAEATRDADRRAALDEAETDRQSAVEAADTEQRGAVGRAREDIQAERQRAVDDQAAAVEDLERRADTERQGRRRDIDDRVARDNATIETEYADARADADAEVARGEREAREKKREAERESENESWWDRAVGFVKRAFQALTAAINAVFDAVRAAVKTILDAARAAATRLIDLAADFIKSAIEGFARFLQQAVDALLGDVFPGIAAALNSAIDRAARVATAVVDAAAEGLKRGVEAIVNALEGALNAVLDVFQSAVNFAVGLVQAAITGDWSGLVKKVLEAVLSLLGIAPETFYGFIGRAMETIGIIVDDPVGFLSNLLDAVLGGIRAFASNFLGHLRRGIVGWLTGALGDIEIPERFDIMGVLSIARQVLGLTWDWLREKAARIIGERNVERLEYAYDWIATLVTEGWQAVFERVREGLTSLKDTVLEGIKTFLVERVIMAGIGWLAGLFSPVGAIVKIVMTVWNLYTFLRDQLSRMMEVVTTVTDSIGRIARGVLDQAITKVEEVFGRLLPIGIDLVARLIGLGNVARSVRRVIERIRERVDRAVDGLIERVLARFTGRRGRRGAGDGAESDAGAEGDRGRETDARDIDVGERLTVTEADGTRHTLSIDVAGREATPMLRSAPLPVLTWLERAEPKIAALEDADKKTRAEGHHAAAVASLRRLDAEADAYVAARRSEQATGGAGGSGGSGGRRALSDDEVDAEQVKLKTALDGLFAEIGGEGTPVLEIFADELDALHPHLKSPARDLLQETPERFHQGGWDTVLDAVKTTEQYEKPLLASRAFGRDLQTAIEARYERIKSDRRFSEQDRQALAPIDDFDGVISNRLLPLVHGGDPALGLVQRALTDNDADPADLARHDTLRAAMLTAARGATGDGVSQALKDAASGRILDFLKDMARDRTSNGYTPADWDTEKDVPANVTWLAGRFRGAGDAEHEWMPSNYIGRVVDRARSASTAEEMAVATKWIDFAHAWRTRTTYLITAPDKSQYARTVDEARDPATGNTTPGSHTVLQGHAGAVYAPVEDGGYRADMKVVPQTKGQGTNSESPGTFHGEIRSIFNANLSKATQAAALTGMTAAIRTFVDGHVWDGGSVPGAAFTEYYDSGMSGKPADLSKAHGQGPLATRAAAARGEVARNTDAALKTLE